MDPAFNKMLEDAEKDHEYPEKNRFVEHRDDQWLVFETVAEPKHFSDEDDFGDDERLNERDPVVQVGDVRFGDDQSTIDGERTHKQPEVKGDHPEKLELLNRSRLQTVFHVYVLIRSA